MATSHTVVSASILMVAGNAMASISADKKLGVDFESPSDDMRTEVGALFNTKEGADVIAVARDSIISKILDEEGVSLGDRFDIAANYDYGSVDNKALQRSYPRGSGGTNDSTGANYIRSGGHSACYYNCYSNCHSACHGSRGWR